MFIAKSSATESNSWVAICLTNDRLRECFRDQSVTIQGRNSFVLTLL